ANLRLSPSIAIKCHKISRPRFFCHIKWLMQLNIVAASKFGRLRLADACFLARMLGQQQSEAQRFTCLPRNAGAEDLRRRDKTICPHRTCADQHVRGDETSNPAGEISSDISH